MLTRVNGLQRGLCNQATTNKVCLMYLADAKQLKRIFYKATVPDIWIHLAFVGRASKFQQ